MLRISCGLKLHCSGWCGSNRNTGGAEYLYLRAGLVAHRLRDDARLLREMRRVRMIEIVGIFQRMRQHEGSD